MVPVLFTFYIQGVLKLKKNNSDAKRLNTVYTLLFFSSKYSLFHNSHVFGSCIIHILYTECAKIKNCSIVTSAAPRRAVLNVTVTSVDVRCVEDKTAIFPNQKSYCFHQWGIYCVSCSVACNSYASWSTCSADMSTLHYTTLLYNTLHSYMIEL